ncbi:MAG: site-specific DNA-methyltransferase, partial [Chitinophagia bacterium]|nr:site-specific DNA-methyltransferase [Chitinophagia bacterium]
MANQLTANQLYYGDNLEVLRKYIPAGSIDLCYIDPPFNSKRNYNQIYNNIGTEDKAQAQAFTDTWTWDDIAIEGYNEITAGTTQLYPLQCIELIIGLKKVLGNGALMAYLISMTLRIAEIYRVLKPTGSFYLHCDPTASHYLKLVLDSLFCARGGEFQNEITWKRYAVHSLSTTRFDSISDIIFYYSKSAKPGCFYLQYEQPDNKNWAKKFPYLEKETNRRFQHVALEQNSNTNSKGEERIINGRKVVSSLGWRWTQKTFDERIAENPYIIYWTETGKP